MLEIYEFASYAILEMLRFFIVFKEEIDSSLIFLKISVIFPMLYHFKINTTYEKPTDSTLV